ncbi:MAG: CRISPR-associated endonuclease Cas2 [Eubacteriales bacterium]|nr:CRISPR-associated endonuclease Cas2 [Eubacteriales bacterium]
MFVVLTYDISGPHIQKVLKICRRYLIHVQNSVFEGTISEAELNHLKVDLEKVAKPETDRICIYRIDNLKYTSKESWGMKSWYENGIL